MMTVQYFVLMTEHRAESGRFVQHDDYSGIQIPTAEVQHARSICMIETNGINGARHAIHGGEWIEVTNKVKKFTFKKQQDHFGKTKSARRIDRSSLLR